MHKQIRIKIKKKAIKFGRDNNTDPINCDYYLFMYMSTQGRTTNDPGPGKAMANAI